MSKKILHLMTQDDQPYGSQRKCCERCGLMMVARQDSFWKDHAWTDDKSEYAAENGGYIRCGDAKQSGVGDE